MINLVNEIAETWFAYMASATFQATILALLILGVLRIGRRWPPALRHALLMLALCKFIIPPMFSLPTGLFNRITPQKLVEQALGMENDLRPVEGIAASTALQPPGFSVKAPKVQPEARRIPSTPFMPEPVFSEKGKLLSLHFFGSLAIFALAAMQRVRLRRMVSWTAPVQDPALLAAYERLCASMKLRNRPRLLIAKDNPAPITFGVWKPVVILPQTLVDALPTTDIRVILGHELAHHRRWDTWLAWLQVVISALWWFNPVYWLLSRSIRSVREDCCDDMVLASGLASRESYCQTLLQAARAALESNAATRTAFAYLGKAQPLRRRFKRIMSAKLVRAPKLTLAGILAVFALALVLLPGVEPRILAQSAAPAENVEKNPIPAPQQSNTAAKAGIKLPDKHPVYSPTNPKAADAMMKNIALNMKMLQAEGSAASNYYMKWLEEDVVYIIPPDEKNEFLALKSDKERDSFIEWFWASRDPASKAEHYRRIAYANEHFASRVPGWKTDRGRIYILYGKPDQLESHPTGGYYAKPYNEGGGVTSTYPFEKWRYRHIDGVGDDIEIEFGDSSGTGEYRMMLIPSGADDVFRRMSQYFENRDLPSGSGSFLLDVKTDYIQQSAEKVFARIAIKIGNKDLEFAKDQGMKRALINYYGIVTDPAGRLIAEWEDVHVVEFPDSEFPQGREKQTEYQKIVALRPSQQFKLNVTAKDLVGKKAVSLALDLNVP